MGDRIEFRIHWLSGFDALAEYLMGARSWSALILVFPSS